MFSRMRDWTVAVFPERQIHFRTSGRVNYFRVKTPVQLITIFLLGISGWWIAYTSYSYIEHGKEILAKNGQIASARLAYHSLLGEVSEYQSKFNTITNDLERNHATMVALVDRNNKLRESLRDISKELRTTKNDRARVVDARETLINKLAELKDNMNGVTNHNFELKDNLNAIESDLKTALSERNHALFEKSRIKNYVGQLEARLKELNRSQHTSIQRLSDHTIGQISGLERIIKLTGIDPKQIINFDDPQTGQGGPFFPFDSTEVSPATGLKKKLDNLDLHLAWLNSLQTAMRFIPMSAPLQSYYITSGYGKRRDPINKRWAAHYGVDFGSNIKASVYATAPGIVRLAGWKGRYGRYVEIDHGNGLRTRYGHLGKIYVKRGEKVEFQ
ncbi:MAG: hypothetical protein CMF69_08285, partial [Magnetovibrio sp.]|nr:hypothetical protein [Magnetovibrio sp.]